MSSSPPQSREFNFISLAQKHKRRLDSRLVGNVWPLKSGSKQHILTINQEIPAVNRYRAKTEDLELEDIEIAKKLKQRTYSNESRNMESHGSYMDVDFNPLKKHEFPKDKYLTKIVDLAKSNGSSDEKIMASHSTSSIRIEEAATDGSVSIVQIAIKETSDKVSPRSARLHVLPD